MRWLATLLYESDDPVATREKALAFNSIGIATEITPGVKTLYRVWRVVKPDPAFVRFRNTHTAIFGESR